MYANSDSNRNLSCSGCSHKVSALLNSGFMKTYYLVLYMCTCHNYLTTKESDLINIKSSTCTSFILGYTYIHTINMDSRTPQLSPYVTI